MPGFIDQYFLGYATIQTNGAPLPQRATLNFLGFTVQDDPVNNVTKVLGGSSGGTSGTLVGDVTTATTISGPTAATVVGLQNRTVASAAPSDTYVLTWSAAHQYWYPASSSSQFGYLTTDVTTAPIAGATVASVLQAASGFKVYNGATTLMTLGKTGASNSPQILFESGGSIVADESNGGSLNLATPSGQFLYFANGVTEFAHFGGTNLVLTGTRVIEFIAGAVFSIIPSNNGSLNSGPHAFTIASESSDPSSTITPNGGPLSLLAGSGAVPGVTGISGSAYFGLNNSAAQRVVEAAEVAVNSRGVALAQIGTGVTSANVPSGDGWVWIGKANVNPGVPTAGFVLYADASTGAAYCCNPGGSPFPLGAGGGTAASATGWYGGGEDGALVLNGTNTYPILQLVNPGTSATYAPYSDVYATTLVVNAGITLASACRILADVSVTNNGTIDCNSGKPGQPGSGTSAGGNAPAGGTLGGGWAGAAGGVGLATGGGVAPITTNSAVVSLTGPLQGGGGGASSASSGGSGGAVGQIGTRPFSQPAVSTGFAISGAGTALVQITGGSGGGGGGSTGTLDAGGGGGSSAGIGAILAPTITNNGVIKSVGGNGGAGFAGSSNAGGGGGGAGGVILITTNSGVVVGNAPVVTGGTGGAGAGSGGLSGQNGTNGKVIYSQP